MIPLGMQNGYLEMNMTTYTEILPPQKTSAHNGINWTPGSKPGTGLLVVHTARATVEYLAVQFGTPWNGIAIRLEKTVEAGDREETGYDVYCDRNGQDHQCSCKGFAYGRGKPCKHVMAVQAIIENGWLNRNDEEPSNPYQDVSNTEFNDRFESMSI
jgi:hypothetical protein